MRRRLWGLMVASVLAGGLAGTASPALAYEDQLTLELGAGYAFASGDTLPHSGLAASALVSYGLGDTLTLRAFGAYAMHPSTANVFTGGADLLYLLDILTVVPYFGGGVDGVGINTPDGTTGAFAVHAVVGLDYLLSRSLTLGIETRPTYMLTGTRFFEVPVYLKIGFVFDL